jgi:hypothetical protein
MVAERRKSERRMGMAMTMSGVEYANARVNVCFVICDSAGSRIMRRRKEEEIEKGRNCTLSDDIKRTV